MLVWKLLTRSTNFCTFGIQLKNIENPWKALRASVLLTKHTAPEKKPSDRSNATRPGEVEKRMCTRARCSIRASRESADSKDKAFFVLWCEACARVVHIALCAGSTSRYCNLFFCFCFVIPVNFPFSNTSENCYYGVCKRSERLTPWMRRCLNYAYRTAPH